MYHFIRKLFISFVLVFCFLQVHGQSTAVRTSINILPPYSVYLSDYVAPSSTKLLVNISITDPNSQELTAKLKITIEGEGITIVTKPNFLPTPLRLTTGINPITTTDLAPYFDPANLNFQGLDRAQFIKSGRLKEGIYQFCVEAVEYNRNIKLSEKSCATAWLLLNNPPQWNLPQASELVAATNPQNMLFNWIPQHTGSPNAAFTTEYEFTLVEIWPENRNPNDAINSQLPLFRTTTAATSLFYGPAEPPLIPGHKYAIRLKAYDKEGRDLFINSGYSEVRVFTFGEACKPPNSETATVENFQKAKIKWSGTNTNTDYTIRYRPYNKNTDSPWYYRNTLLPYVYLDSLNANTQYEYSIKASCGSIASEYGLPNTFTLPIQPIDNFECKEAPTPAMTGNTVPKKDLRIGQKITVGGYTMEVTSIKEDVGLWTGTGVIAVPFLNNIRLATHFTQILVNENNEVTAGQVHTDRAALGVTDAETKAKITEMMNGVEKGFTTTDKYLDNANNIIKEVNNIADQVPDKTKQLLQQGKEQIEKGKQLIANGDLEGGKALIEKGKGLIKDAVGMIKEGGGGAVEGVDKLREMFLAVIKEKYLTLAKDSSNQSKLVTENDEKFEKLKMEFETAVYTTSAEDEMYLEQVEVDASEDNMVSESVILNAPSNVFNTTLTKSLHTLSTQRFEAIIVFKNIQNQLSWLSQYQVPDGATLASLVEDFKKEGAAILKKYALDKLNNKETEDLKTQIKTFTEKKLNEIIAKKD